MMGWTTSVANWGKTLRGYTAKAAAAASYTYRITDYLLQQIIAVPKVAYTVVTHRPTRAVAGHLLYIFYADVLPLVLVNVVHDKIQEQGRTYLENEPENNYFLINAGLSLLQLANWIYSTRQKTKFLVDTVIVTIEAPRMLSGVSNTAPMTVCREAQCTFLRKFKGSVRDFATYWATESLISLVGYIPVAGGPVAAMLAVHHRGRYVLTLLLPDLCNRHHVIYLQQYSELAWSVGLMHFGSSWAFDALVESYTGIPPRFYHTAIEQLLLITQIGVTAQLSLPAPVLETKHRAIDPVSVYQYIVGSGFDWSVKELKEFLRTRIPTRDLKDMLVNLPWSTLTERADRVWSHPVAHIFLPKLLHDAQSFMHDPIVRTNWISLQHKFIHDLRAIESVKDYKTVRVSKYFPNGASSLVGLLFGTPKAINKLLLQLLTDPKVIEQVRLKRYKIQALHLEPTHVQADDKAFQMRMPSPPPADEQSSLSEWIELLNRDAEEDAETEQVAMLTGPEQGSALSQPVHQPLLDKVIRHERGGSRRGTDVKSATINVIRHGVFRNTVRTTQREKQPKDLQDWVVATAELSDEDDKVIAFDDERTDLEVSLIRVSRTQIAEDLIEATNDTACNM